MSSLLAAGAGLYAAANAFGIGIGTTAVGATMAVTGLALGRPKWLSQARVAQH